ncbi:hypothetical protein H9P43_000669 [Blastocladiella emersonii ATCC 22665]|nr:hypothetical protein H9P43_000669 [Blastocladiella emersonii ATCC 22665]
MIGSTGSKKKSSAATSASQVAVKRLMWDLKELQSAPLEHVAATPVEGDGGSNLFEWHANLRGPADLAVEPLRGTVWHAVVRFPAAYPAAPPQVALCTGLPQHPNVHRHGAEHRVCLDMFETDPDKMTAGAGWSSAYSVRSVLMQLQAFLWDSRLEEGASDDEAGVRAAAAAAAEFQCSACGHSASAPFPALPGSTSSTKGRHAVTAAAGGAQAVPEMPKTVLEQLGMVRRLQAEYARTLNGASGSGAGAGPQKPVAYARGTRMRLADGWTLVTRANAHPHQSVLDQVYAATKKPVAAPPSAPAPVAAPVSVAKDQQQLEKPKLRVLTLSSVAHVRHILPSKAAQYGLPANASTKPVVAETVAPAAAPVAAKQSSAVDPTKAGRLGLLPTEVLLQVLGDTDPRALIAFGGACRWLHGVAQAAEVWRRFRPAYAASGAASEDTTNWRYAYLAEHNNAARDLRCWYTRVPFADDVLGFPVEATWNPRTRKLDYAVPTLAWLSQTAFRDLGVRRTPEDRRAFAFWLPAYLTQEHFNRAWPAVREFITSLAAEKGDTAPLFAPRMILEVFPKLLNTCAVLLADRGMYASDAAVEMYTQVHRVWVACMHRYPRLQAEVERRLARFIDGGEDARSKGAEPSLGDLVALLSVSERYAWRDLAPALISESMARAVLWLGKANPAVVKTWQAVPLGKPPTKADTALLDAAFESSAVSRRLFAFHALFLREHRGLGGQDGAPIKSVTEMALTADVLYGKLPARVSARIQRGIRSILDATPHWGAWYKSVAVTPLSPVQATRAWHKAVHASLAKGYHTRRTDFAKVQSSGVSKILLRGESYTVPPNLSLVAVEETWRYPTDSTIFLDASVLLLDAQGNSLEHIKWNNTCSIRGNGAVRHSGDIVDHAKKEGTHRINIDLGKPPREIVHLAFFMTGYTTALSAVRDPFIRLADGTNVAEGELASYTFTEDEAGQSRSVMMAVLSRSGTEGAAASQWKMQATGVFGDGTTTIEGPLKATAQRFVHGQ